MIDVTDSTALRLLDGHRLHDHAAHRGADDVGGADAEHVEQAGGVGGHVGERVGHLERLAGRRPWRTRSMTSMRTVVEVGRPADVAVVEADDAEAAVDEAVDEAARAS